MKMKVKDKKEFPSKLLPLESERLTYGHFAAEDLGFIHHFHNTPGVTNDPNLLPLPIPLDNARTWLNNQLLSYATEGMGHLSIHLKETGEFVGRNGLRIIEIVKGVNGTKDRWYWYRGSAPKGEPVQRELELGYAFHPKFWNRGYATESTIALCNLAFEKGLADRVVAAVSATNPASARVLEKCGFKQTGEVFGLGLDLVAYALKNKT